MKLMGKDITAAKLLEVAKERLQGRGLLPPSEETGFEERDVEAPIEPFSFAVDAMSEHVDATRGLPIETHRDGLQGRAVVLVKRTFRALGQVFINEALARQVAFNGLALDGFSQLSAEVVRLRKKVEELEAARARPAEPPAKKKPKAPRRRA